MRNTNWINIECDRWRKGKGQKSEFGRENEMFEYRFNFLCRGVVRKSRRLMLEWKSLRSLNSVIEFCLFTHALMCLCVKHFSNRLHATLFTNIPHGEERGRFGMKNFPKVWHSLEGIWNSPWKNQLQDWMTNRSSPFNWHIYTQIHNEGWENFQLWKHKKKTGYGTIYRANDSIVIIFLIKQASTR